MIDSTLLTKIQSHKFSIWIKKKKWRYFDYQLKVVEASKKYTIGGWGSINPDVEGPAIFNVLEDFILDKQNISPMQNNPVTIKGI